MSAVLATTSPCMPRHAPRVCVHGSSRPEARALRIGCAPRLGPAHAARKQQAADWRRRGETLSCATSCSAAAAPPLDHRGPPGWARAASLAAAAVGLCLLSWTSLAPAAPNATPFASVSAAALGITGDGLRSAVRSAWAGLFAGCLHTLAGADHLAALTPLTIGRSHLRASLLGALWGFGHSTGQLILGLAMVLLKDRFTQLVPALTKWGGATVGLTLVGIGLLGIYETFFEEHHQEAAAPAAAAASDPAAGLEVQPDGTLAVGTGTPAGTRKERSGFQLATYATGILYGLQPDALFVIVPALALPTKLAAATYIVTFVLGTVGAMGAYTGLIGATSAAISRKNADITKRLSGAAAAVAIAVGTVVLLSGLGVELPFSLPGAH